MNHSHCAIRALLALVLAAALASVGCAGPRGEVAPADGSNGVVAAAPAPLPTPPAPAEPALPGPATSAPDIATPTKPPAMPTAKPSPGESPTLAAGLPASGLACRSNADCVVKDVGSCCGYQPRCMNSKAETFPDRVKDQCAREGRVSTCGFREIAGCECLQGKCAATHDADDGGVVH